MSKKIAKKSTKKVQKSKTKPKGLKTTSTELLELMIDHTRRTLNLGGNKPDAGMVAQIKRLQKELDEIVNAPYSRSLMR